MKKILEAKDKQLNAEQQISLLLILATFKSLTEQLYNIKGAHKGILKKRFNLVIATFRSYERELDATWFKNNTQAIEDLHDALTDMIYTLRNAVLTENKDKI